MNFSLVQVHISSRHSNLNFAHHFVIYWLFQNGANKNQHQDSNQRETVPDKFVFFSNLVRQKKTIGRTKYVYMYVSEICAEGIFVTFPWWLENVKSRLKIAFFFLQMSAILKFDLKKREQLRFSKVNYPNYTKRPNFACGNYIFPKTRGNKNKPWTHSTPLKIAKFEFKVTVHCGLWKKKYPVVTPWCKCWCILFDSWALSACTDGVFPGKRRSSR